MDATEVRQLLGELRRLGGETTRVEVKAAVGGLPQSLRETLSSFSNTPGGGAVILGVSEEDGFALVGVADPAKIQSDFAAACSEEMTPPLRPQIEMIDVDGVVLVAAEIPELPKADKPCYVKARGVNNGTYIRVGDSDRRLNSEEVQQLVADRGQPAFDREPVPGTSRADLDDAAVRAYCDRLRNGSHRLFGGETEEKILRMTNVLHHSGDDPDLVTLAGLLALGRYPQQFFPQLNLTFVHYPTAAGEATSSGVRFIDNVSIDGSIPEIVAESMAVLFRNMSRRALIAGSGRRDVWEYPEQALREAIVNALVHRDLSTGSRGMQVQVEMYPDRLVLKNPGGLFGPIDVSRLGEDGTSSSRNAVLLKTLEDVVLPGEDRAVCENRGSGIRSMLAALRQAGMGMPLFTDRVTRFQVTLPNHTLLDDETVAWLASLGRGELRDSQCIALAHMRKGLVMSNAAYRAATGVTDSREATFELQDLVARELVEQTGTRGGARYLLSEFAIADSPARRRPRPDRRRQVLDLLEYRQRPLSKTEIADALSLNPKTVEHWLRVLKAEGRIASTSGTKSRNTKYSRVAPVADEAGVPGQAALFDEL